VDRPIVERAGLDGRVHFKAAFTLRAALRSGARCAAPRNAALRRAPPSTTAQRGAASRGYAQRRAAPRGIALLCRQFIYANRMQMK